MMTTLSIALNVQQHPNFMQDWQQSGFLSLTHDWTGEVSHYIDGKGLACPMPLLKLKIALKSTAVGDHVYLTATDPNSQHDIAAFCQHAKHTLMTSVHDTIIHLLITKNC